MRKMILGSLVAAVCFCGAKAWAAGSADLAERGYTIQRMARKASPENIGKLARAIDDPEPSIAYAAARALAQIGNGPAGDALLAAMKKGKVMAAGDAALACAQTRLAQGDRKQGEALLELCYTSGPEPLKCAALSALALLKPAKYAPAIQAALTSERILENRAAVHAVRSSVAFVPVALEALKTTRDEKRARVITALAAHSTLPEVRKALTAALADPSEAVRLVALKATAATCDPAALEAIWQACSKKGEEERVARLMIQSNAASETDPFLYSKMKNAATRVLAIELLASRHQPDLIGRLCDASIYTDASVGKAAAGAFRTALQAPQLAKAFTFVFTELPAVQRAPFVPAISSVVRQLPDAWKDLIGMFEKLPSDTRMEAMPVIASIQSPEVSRLLENELKADNAEYRKAIVRELAKWDCPAALDTVVRIAEADADGAVRILALRSALSLLDKRGMANQAKKNEVFTALAGTAERDAEKRLIYARLQMEKGEKFAALRRTLAKGLKLDEEDGTPVLAVNMGGPAVGKFLADTATSGIPFRTNEAINRSEAVKAAPEAVYQSARYQNSAYSYQGFKPSGTYMLRLHYAELYHKQPGLRAGDVIVNGIKVVSNLPSREFCKAFTVTCPITADAKGKIEIRFETTRDQVMVNGFEILEKGKAAEVPAITVASSAAPALKIRPPTPGKINVLLLTGSNNHDWKKTTPAICQIFAKDDRFAVTVVDRPWDMKPADIQGYDLLFSNWNTFGKRGKECKSHEWGQKMKDAFLAWIKKGGGFFVLHAGGSFFYDWKEFQQLIGGTWGKGTYHPHKQAFTVHIVNKDHPVTRGFSDFETFDEPWQRLSNNNPDRQVLATMTIPKQNRGTGNAEIAAFTTTMGAGRCFNLVLGHDVRGITNPGCAALLLRGAEWAATGKVR